MTDVTDSLYRPYTRARVSSYTADVSHLSQATDSLPAMPSVRPSFSCMALAKKAHESARNIHGGSGDRSCPDGYRGKNPSRICGLRIRFWRGNPSPGYSRT